MASVIRRMNAKDPGYLPPTFRGSQPGLGCPVPTAHLLLKLAEPPTPNPALLSSRLSAAPCAPLPLQCILGPFMTTESPVCPVGSPQLHLRGKNCQHSRFTGAESAAEWLSREGGGGGGGEGRVRKVGMVWLEKRQAGARVRTSGALSTPWSQCGPWVLQRACRIPPFWPLCG